MTVKYTVNLSESEIKQLQEITSKGLINSYSNANYCSPSLPFALRRGYKT